jgi:hypothetical protein
MYNLAKAVLSVSQPQNNQAIRATELHKIRFVKFTHDGLLLIVTSIAMQVW